MTEYFTVSFSDIVSHDNMSAEYWAKHDRSKCSICKKGQKKKAEKKENNEQQLVQVEEKKND